ncbi:MAG: flagellar biosynthesis protein FlhB [Chitinispirillaceae bacterium]|nr:flagellar biosynthesis protein FlhB [Chitinispirillaceae bacterium]
MAEESAEEKTEAPSEKKRRDAREKGTVAMSTEINSVVVLLTGILMIKLLGSWIYNEIALGATGFFAGIADCSMNHERCIHLTYQALLLMAKASLPIAGAILVAGVAANIAQIGFLFTTKPLMPNFEKINPVSGFGRLFSIRSLFEAVKNIAKLSIIALVAWLTLKAEFGRMLHLADTPVTTIWQFMLAIGFKVMLRIALVLIILAIIDYAYQRFDYEKKLRMSHQELKEERKQLEGDPQIKARIRSLQREMARRRMMERVPKATVVVTNPTYIAIALRYEPARQDAPVVVAKGKRLIAERIRELARENGVPIIEDKPLARAMYDKVTPGMAIPVEFFTAVAEIMAYVYRLRNRSAA